MTNTDSPVEKVSRNSPESSLLGSTRHMSERAKKIATNYVDFKRSTKTKSNLKRIFEHKLKKFTRKIAKERPQASKLDSVKEEMFSKVKTL